MQAVFRSNVQHSLACKGDVLFEVEIQPSLSVVRMAVGTFVGANTLARNDVRCNGDVVPINICDELAELRSAEDKSVRAPE
jgi:hypothetical protein